MLGDCAACDESIYVDKVDCIETRAAYALPMAEHRVERGTQAVLVLDGEGRVVASHWFVPMADVPGMVASLQVSHPDGNVIVDGQPVGGEALAGSPGPLASLDATGTADQGQFAGVRLAHSMLWTTFDRAARVQAWMLEQANVFTRDLLENNRKLADQASEMQQRFQQAMQRIDLMETEQKLIEHDLMARRLSRHSVAQNHAEEEASRPPAAPDHGWIGELLSGVSTLIGGVRPPPKTWPKN
jgi:hypothetical protein